MNKSRVDLDESKQQTNKQEGQLTLDLILLCLESRTRGLVHLLQLEVAGVLLLASVVQLLK
jgi:hypothetical protein